ncbi:MAG TPA: PCRF domain-containing protein, partial [Aquifex aeolicus]|nr:PCRF domain-containing protein [Aquifex aeolicus]
MGLQSGEHLRSRVEELKERLGKVRAVIDEDSLRKELKNIDERMSSGDFWEDQERAKAVVQRRKWLEETLSTLMDMEKSLRDVEELLEEEDEDTSAILSDEVGELERKLRKLELRT